MRHYKSLSVYVKAVLEVIYQTWKTLFHHISKHRENMTCGRVLFGYAAKHSHELFISFQLKLQLRRERTISIYKGIFELFHILVFPNNRKFLNKKRKYFPNKEIMWLRTPTPLRLTMLLCKIALFYVNINKSIIVCHNSSYVDISG